MASPSTILALVFVGLMFLYAATFVMIPGVGSDAEYIVTTFAD